MRLNAPRSLVPIVALLSMIGCAYDEVELISTGPLDDLARIPQDASLFAKSGATPVQEADGSRLANFEEYWYGPWEQTEPGVCTPEEFSWAARSFSEKAVFGPNMLEISASGVEAVTANARLSTYPSRSSRGITVRNTAMRALPSADPFYYDFRDAGEGYPFDYNQNSAVWAGTPLYISHTSRDGRFLAAESPYTCGWIDARDIAFVDPGFVEDFRSKSLTAVLRDRIPINSDETGFLFQGRIGMLLPLASHAGSEMHLLAPVADEGRRALLLEARISERDAAGVPLPFSDDQIAMLINEIIGQPYGWGGLGGHRDCSSTLLDIFLPVALPLPRNSGKQAGAGKVELIEQLSVAEKRERILAEAIPFRTTLNMAGHIMLYLGEFEGDPVAFHTIWGLRTESADGSSSGRYLIGRSVITGLSPGLEISTLSRSRGDLLSRITSFTVLGEL